MHPILLSLLLGLTAAAANVFGGAIIVQKNWERSYLKYFIALGAGFMLATAIVEIFPAALELNGKNAAFLVLVGYLIIHFFEHTVTPHFHFGEETHQDEFAHTHKGYSVLLGSDHSHVFRRHRDHRWFHRLRVGWDGSFSWRFSCTRFLKASPSLPSCWPAAKAAVWPGVLLCCWVQRRWREYLTMAVFKHQVSYGLPLAAGVTIYVAASDLIPEVNREPGARVALVVFLGVGLMFLLDHLAHAALRLTPPCVSRCSLRARSPILHVFPFLIFYL